MILHASVYGMWTVESNGVLRSAGRSMFTRAGRVSRVKIPFHSRYIDFHDEQNAIRPFII